MSHFETALAEAKRIENEQPRLLAIAKATNDLAWLRHNLGQTDEAREKYTQALEAFQKLEPPPLELIATVQFSLGPLLFDAGQRAAGLDMVFQSLKTRRDLHGDRHEDVIDSHQQLGSMLLQAQQFRDAREHFDEARRIAELLFGPQHLRVAEVWGHLAHLAEVQNDYPRMLDAAQRRLELLRAAPAVPRDDLAHSWNAVGIAKYQLGKHRDAADAFIAARENWLNTVAKFFQADAMVG